MDIFSGLRRVGEYRQPPRAHLWPRLPALPRRCPLCATWSMRPVCTACWQRFAPLPAPTLTQHSATVGAATHTLAGAAYAFPWDAQVRALKFHAALAAAPLLAGLIAQAAAAHAADVDALVPVPLGPARLSERGYNQAERIARALGRQLGLPVHAGALLRLSDTAPQSAQGRRARLESLRGAFIAHPAQAHRLRGLRLALVDDVLTTGATALAATLALREAGAASVQVWVACATPPPSAAHSLPLAGAHESP